MQKIGITGNIGSGKTTVCRIFEALGIPVYYADARAKRLMVENVELRAGIEVLFGAESYRSDGSLHRAHIAQRAFADKSLLSQLNALVHPAVRADAERWHRLQTAPYTLHEAALTYETGGDQRLDRVIVVAAPEALRLARVVDRDGANETEVRARMQHQMPEDEKVARADFVVQNDGRRLLIPQVLDIHRMLTQPPQKTPPENPSVR